MQRLSAWEWAGAAIIVFMIGAQLVPVPGATDDSGAAISEDTTHLVEANVTAEVNAARTNRSLGALDRSDRLDELAQAQADDMAAETYVGHINSDGEDIRERYNEAGLLPACRLPAGPDQHYAGAEVVNAVSEGNYLPSGTGGGEVYISTPAEAAAVIVEEFIASPEHRVALLVSAADEIGVGVALHDEKVYVAVEFC